MNYKFIANSNFVLREVLNQEEALDIIKNMIQSLLHIQIIHIEFIDSKAIKLQDRLGIAEVKIIAKNGELFNIGIQLLDGSYIKTKMLYYYLQISHHQKLISKRKTITIHILNQTYFKSRQYHSHIKIPYKNKRIEHAKEIEMHLFELPKICPMQNRLIPKKAWLMYFKGMLGKEVEYFKYIKKLDGLLNEYWKQETL